MCKHGKQVVIVESVLYELVILYLRNFLAGEVAIGISMW